ncbi:MAG TPA: lysine-sensitive aspartokinase 3 [Gemmatimonadales bacterium]|nr:lysine-sensitive aspartokinase 3 [Gemmatimonadales bacterium]
MSESTVLKFGGTSVADAEALQRVAGLVSRAHRSTGPIVVVSALAGVTDTLLAAADAAASGDAERMRPQLDALLERHAEIAGRLAGPEGAQGIRTVIGHAGGEIAGLLERVARDPERRPALRDEIASYGERLSAALLTAVLLAADVPARYVDARHCLITDETHGRATPLLPDTEQRTRTALAPLLDRRLVPVLGGYIGATPEGVTTTLGRGGSDYSAALVGAALGAAEIQIWTDVSGVLTADPRVVPGARTIPSLSYAEAAELAYFGAKVLHPKTIQPAMDRGIPVRICNSRAPNDPGTVVTARGEVRAGAVKAIAHKSGITVLQISSTRMLGAYGFLRGLFDVFERHQTVVDVVTTSEVSVSLTVDDARSLPAIVAELQPLGTVAVESGRAIVCVVGEGLRTTPGIAARVFATISDINVSLISQGASRVNLTFVVDEARVRETVHRLHEALFEREPADVDAAAATGAP